MSGVRLGVQPFLKASISPSKVRIYFFGACGFSRDRRSGGPPGVAGGIGGAGGTGGAGGVSICYLY